jgi:hypothetical protein
MKIVIVALAIAAVAFASASHVDTVVPEEVDTNLAQTESSQGNLQDMLVQEAEYSEAKNRVKALQAQGKDDKACRDVAEADKKAVSESVQSMQKILNGLDKGSGCKGEGQSLEGTARTIKDEAFQDLGGKQSAESKLASKKVVFEPTFKSMSGSCAVAKTDPKYVAAKKEFDQAKSAVASAQGSYNMAKTAHEEAVEAAEKAKKACECKAQEEHAAQWKTANQDNASNQEAWTKATNMLCVLDREKLSDCKHSNAPKVTKPSLDIATQTGCAEAPVSNPIHDFESNSGRGW